MGEEARVAGYDQQPVANVSAPSAVNGSAIPEPMAPAQPEVAVLSSASGEDSYSVNTSSPSLPWALFPASNDTTIPVPTASAAEIQCYLSDVNRSADARLDTVLSCLPTWDGLSCWPRTPPAHTSSIPCFATLNGVHYDTTQNASRFCSAAGIWASKSDYSHCVPLFEVERPIDGTTLYYIGYGMSLCALSIALWIFIYYKELRCLRNTIHVNLMVTYFLISITWMTTATLQSVPSPAYHKSACFMYVVLTYLMGTNFFWMFVEGLYLFILVVKTFSVEMVRVHVYAAIGWGIPLVVVSVWAVTKAYLSPNHNDPNLSGGMCIWQLKDIYDCIFIGPVILVLLTNIFFLSHIMWVLITKLRAATSVESQQYRKAAKALLVLIPLLGVSYILVIWTPQHKTARVIFTYLQITLLSTQGFTVAVLYCFLNGEVRNSVRHHLERWKTMRALRRGSDRCRQALGYGRVQKPLAMQRGSCVSFTTTTTTTCLPSTGSRFTSQQSKRPSNGSYAQLPFTDNPV
ncbi:diuretic hormone receptor-like [Dermacentor andersoni]|uniref:diuretic hormone receptor-like n=1 Tax=Dermacentor andersoni TaxID=34620 RepID=UPI00215540DF|nr:diuretic hormone receptor-like [Dermacentor andersoni]